MVANQDTCQLRYKSWILSAPFVYKQFTTKPKNFLPSYIKNSQNSANCSLITDNQFLLGKIKQNAFSFLRLNVHQKLNISYRDRIIKWCHTVKYLGCHLASNVSGKSIAMKVSKKVDAIQVFKTKIERIIV